MKSYKLFNINVSATQIPAAIATMEQWTREKSGVHYIVLGGMHGMMETQRDQKVLSAMQGADLVVTDGMPLVWLARLHGHSNMKRRVYGPELMLEFCKQTRGKYRHFFYGGNDGVAGLLAKRLQTDYQIQVAGVMTPPFRPITDDELRIAAETINQSQADIVWIGISTPKQELLMQRLKSLLNPCIMLGVGAAFDFNTGLKKTAPSVFQENGFEWAFRLATEPKRLWYRYLVLGPQFVFLASRDFLQQKLGPDKR